MSKTYTLDASDKALGRIASEAALCLRGKRESGYARNRTPDVYVKIVNTRKMKLDPGKLEAMWYTRYSGYPSGLKRTRMRDVLEKKGTAAVMRHAVYGMLPHNKLRKIMLKNLEIVE